ncbi:MAG: DNA cytosine methyltransferase [Alphaproteobacteria bacterium]|nr:DNA cytosine methyltransferase [Alphaproteobacteria bacterium]
MLTSRPTFLEFFAGGGMARQGLAGMFDAGFSNDFDPMKCATYRRNFVGEPIAESDVWNLDASALPTAHLAWASFPCQDLSLAGARRGLNAPRSGAFWGFWNIIEALDACGRAPRTLVLENVTGLLSSHNGRDFASLVSNLADSGYRVGALVIDASLFSPQSRQRLFIVAHKGRIADGFSSDQCDPGFHPQALRQAVAALPHNARLAWVWWTLPHPPRRNVVLAAVLDRDPPAPAWRSYAATRKLIGQMAPLHRARFDAALADRNWNAGAVFRRIRTENGKRIQRAEIRYDGLAGCLRTPGGGSSKQLLLVTHNGEARLRPLLATEAARLMGCDEGFVLPEKETAALKVLGDGVSVPVVRWLGRHLLLPLVESRARLDAAA